MALPVPPPEPEADDDRQDLSQLTHRRLVGILGLALPLLLYLVAGLRPTTGLQGWELLPSVSAYYYTGAVGFFVGVLFALSLFLISYPGYKDARADRILGSIGGGAALGVALFPTAAPDGVSAASWWTPALRIVHYTSSVVLFVSFILFALWLFRKSSVANAADRPVDKRWRDRVCLACGITMIVAVLWCSSSVVTHAPMFWPESIAIVAFAISWLAKGEAHRPLLRIWRFLTGGRGAPTAS